MKIAVIGATGMIGYHTAASVIERGHELTVIHRQSSDLSKLGHLLYHSACADLSDEQALIEALSNVDAVINCAAPYPSAPISWQDEVQRSLSIMEVFYRACGHVDLHKIVYLGGAIALRKHPQGLAGDETLEYDSQPSNKNPYLQAKWAMDAQAKRKAEEGLPVVIGIPSMTFGDHDYGPSTGQLLVGIANQTLPGYVKGRRNVIYAGDAGLGLVLACEKGVVGERYLFTGTNVSMDDLVAKMCAISDAPSLKTIPLFVAKAVSSLQRYKYRWLNGELPVISDTAIAVMSSGQFLDGSKAQQDLGFKATLSLDQTLHKAYQWFIEEGYIKPKRASR